MYNACVCRFHVDLCECGCVRACACVSYAQMRSHYSSARAHPRSNAVNHSNKHNIYDGTCTGEWLRIKHFWHSSQSKITPFTVSPIVLTCVHFQLTIYLHVMLCAAVPIAMQPENEYQKNGRKKKDIHTTHPIGNTRSQQRLWTINAVPVNDISFFHSLLLLG